MGVDNSGYLVIGNEFDKINFENFPMWDEIEDDTHVNDFYGYLDKPLLELRLDWRLENPSGYNDTEVFGWCLTSPSYGSERFNFMDFVSDLGVISKAWRKWTGQPPVVFVLNLQW